ncbi:hypothetical protein HDF26_003561 [Pedobacter cryoconitis]|uniref:YXWGXW repeat-containing protein n=1 Tax=Pedobacter cryoconitis TaxID=188932 RepID=A0A7W8ZLG8_9SPHI|nr:hypothetical protein [Pedobacter cryoconitis]MBB5635983.1 hypothetical protein [Pedobacter cryoconitis]MBB6273101.1 hypothetical protein [Pedobacter cryoconitis]
MKLTRFFIAALVMISFSTLAKAQSVVETVYPGHYYRRVVVVHRPAIVERVYERPVYYYNYRPSAYYRPYRHYYRHCW